MSDYSGERSNPTIPQCKLIWIEYNSVTLTLHGTKTYRYPAYSGKPPFDYTVTRQKMSGIGPIPEGRYWIRPDEIDTFGAWSVFKSDSWGKMRVTIHPYPVTETYGRGGFFIHGGDVAGSAGCIDLVLNASQFGKDVMAEVGSATACHIPIMINYMGTGDFPVLSNGNAYA